MSLRIANPQINQFHKNYGGDRLNRRDAANGRRIQAAERSLETQKSAKLEIKTREGDTVTLSFAAQSSVQVQSIKTPELEAQSRKSTSSLSFNLSVEGELSDAEVADIQKVLASLNTPDNSPKNSVEAQDLGSLGGYTYAYQSSSSYASSRLSYRG